MSCHTTGALSRPVISTETVLRNRKRHDYTIGTLDVLQACDSGADMDMTYSVIVQCTDSVVFPRKILYKV